MRQEQYTFQYITIQEIFYFGKRNKYTVLNNAAIKLESSQIQIGKKTFCLHFFWKYSFFFLNRHDLCHEKHGQMDSMYYRKSE